MAACVLSKAQNVSKSRVETKTRLLLRRVCYELIIA